MRKAAILSDSLVFVLIFGSAAPALADAEVNIYSYRQPELIQPMLDAFTRETGINTNVLFLDKGLIERMKTEGENSQADIVLTVDINRLDDLKRAGVTQALDDPIVNAAIPAKFRDPDGQWFGLSMDARAVYASKDRASQHMVTYEDLADPRWKGKICLRDGRHSSNLGLFADMIARHGLADTEKWLRSLKANLAQRPSGSDTSQVEAIAAGKCDMAIGNATVVALMRTGTKDEQKWAGSVRVIYPGAAGDGSYANISGVALAKYAPNRENAVKLMKFLTSKEAQDLYAKETLEYPIVSGALPADAVKDFGSLKPDATPMSDIVKYRDQASALVDKVGFNDAAGQ